MNRIDFCKSRIEACILDIKSWMIQSKLKMTDIAVISS